MRRKPDLQATRILEKNGVNSAPVDVWALAESQGVRVLTKQLEDSVSGVLVIRGGRAVAGINEDHHPHRQRFTIAHELGHFCLHHDEANIFVDSTSTFYRDRKTSQGVDRQEIDANAFAAQLLMPDWLIIEHLLSHDVDLYDEISVRWLASQFEVSEQAMTFRLINMGLVSA